MQRNATCQYFLLTFCFVLFGVMVVLGAKPSNTPVNDPSLIQRINSKKSGWKAKAHQIFEGKTIGELKNMFITDPSVLEHFRDVIDKINQSAKEKEENARDNNNGNAPSNTNDSNEKNGQANNANKKKTSAITRKQGKRNNTSPPKKSRVNTNRIKSNKKNSTNNNNRIKKSSATSTKRSVKRTTSNKVKPTSPPKRRVATSVNKKAVKQTNNKRRTLRVGTGGASTLAADDSGIPESFDIRTKWPKCKPRIKQQQECGSCYAFTATGILAHRYCIASGGSSYPDLSPDYIVRCNSATKKCKGGKTTSTWEFLESTGVPSDSCVRYRSGFFNVQECPKVCDDGATPLKMFKAQPGSFKQYVGETEIKKAIMRDGAVHTIMIALRDFLTYESGIYKRNSDSLIGVHAVQLVGWGKEKGEDYWLGANSWGETWGLNGYFKIKMGEVAIGGQTHAALPLL